MSATTKDIENPQAHLAKYVVQEALVFRHMQAIDTVVPWSREFLVNTL